MTAHLPPVPPEQRPRQGEGKVESGQAQSENAPPQDPNPREQGRQGATNQNTHNKGYQQDR
jgi:hypothetical protein